MTAPRVVEAFNVVEDVGACFIAGGVARLAVNPLLLEPGEEVTTTRVAGVTLGDPPKETTSMDTVSSWVRTPYRAQGLDHLGSQAPCIALYAQLVPGITNVTNRARYYTAYPWLIYALEKNGMAADEAQFVEHFRRGDCLLTLISERHAKMTNDNVRHADGMVGRDTLVPALAELGLASLDLTEYTSREEGNDKRYFKNRLGGLGQYYLGALHDLQVLDASEQPWVRYTAQIGEPFAKAVEVEVPSSLFIDTIRRARVTTKQLDQLSKFCFCHLRHETSERALLYQLLFQRAEREEPGALQRRQTFCLLLSWVQQQRVAADASMVDGFRRSIYVVDADGDAGAWKIPSALVPIARGWKTYERNDLMSVAVQAVFFAALQLARWEGKRFGDVAAFRNWFEGTPVVQSVPRVLGGKRWRDAAKVVTRGAPSVDRILDIGHEEGICEAILEAFKQPVANEAARIFALALRLLVLLDSRDDSDEADPYAACPLPTGYLEDYPVNLRAFRRAAQDDWPGMDVAGVLTSLAVTWGIETHFRIALRKLRHNSQSTFKIKPGDRGLEIDDDIPGPAPTNPRLSQAFRMLEDFDLIRGGSEGGAALTPAGVKLLAYGTDP